MNLKGMTRKEKEQLYKDKQTELQRLWENPRPTEADFDFSDWKDEDFQELIDNTVRAIRREKRTYYIAMVVTLGLYAFVGLGVFGLLVFGIKQLF